MKVVDKVEKTIVDSAQTVEKKVIDGAQTIEKYVKHPVIEEEAPTYTFLNYIEFFFIFCFLGWFWEVALHFVQTGDFVNRGTLFGPWLPIYGVGGILIIIFLRKIYKYPVLTFVISLVICSVVEYFTSYFLEKMTGLRWWDYSGYLLNLNGRICLAGSVAFGIGGSVMTYFIAPKMVKYLNKIKKSLQIIICVILIILFSIDAIYSKSHPNIGKGVTDDNIRIHERK
jgi:uncharacterized membrane protein